MNYSSNGTEKKRAFEKDYESYVNDIYRLCFSYTKNHVDAEDMVAMICRTLDKLQCMSNQEFEKIEFIEEYS